MGDGKRKILMMREREGGGQGALLLDAMRPESVTMRDKVVMMR